MTSWSVHFTLTPFTIDKSFSLVVFRGTVPKDPLTWLTSPELIGSYDVFISYQPDECENCREHQDVPIEGFVHLTSMLRDKPSNVRTDQDVARYLQETLYLGLIKVREPLFRTYLALSLTWRIQVDNIIVDLHTIEFKAEVVSRGISRGADGQEVDIGQPNYYPFDIKPFDVFHR